MAAIFLYDVFLNFPSEVREIARSIAVRLREDGIRVWFDEWELNAGENISEKLSSGLESSRVMILFMSADLFGPDWTAAEAMTFKFRDPLNSDRRFIPLRLDGTPVINSLAQYLHLSWLPEDRFESYPKLLEACRPVTISEKRWKENEKNGFESMAGSVGHQKPVNSVLFSRDGQKALSASEDGIILLWDLEGGYCRQVYEGFTDGVRNLGWSQDGKYAVSGSADKTLRYWDFETGLFDDQVISGWNLAFGPDLKDVKGQESQVVSLAINNKGNLALAGSEDHQIRLWDLKTGHCLKGFEGHQEAVTAVRWSQDEQFVFSCSSDRTIRLWEKESGRCLRVFEGHTDRVLSIESSTDGRYLASCSRDKTIRVWEVESGRCLRVLKGHKAAVLNLGWANYDLSLLSADEDGTIMSWEVENGEGSVKIENRMTGIKSMEWAADGRRLLIGSANSATIWDVEKGQSRSTLNHPGTIFSKMALRSDDEFVLTGSTDGKVILWNLQSATPAYVFKGHSSEIRSLAWGSDDYHVVSGDESGIIFSWDLRNDDLLSVPKSHTGAVTTLSAGSDDFVLSSSSDGSIKVWEMLEFKYDQLIYFTGHSAGVIDAKWSTTKELIASASDDKTIRVWDQKDNRCIRVLEGHTGRVKCVTWSPDDLYLLSGDEEGQIRLWEVESGRCLQIFSGHSKTVMDIVWADPDFASSIAANGVWRKWDLSHWKNKIISSSDFLPDQIQYTNAKVLLVGDSGVGKTGLSNYLALGMKDNARNSSTDGAWATHWALQHEPGQNYLKQEIWLWDFAGQVDYRLVHQLFMDETAAAVLVFNPQDENPFEGLGQWDQDLQKAARKPFAKLLAAGRVDRGGIVVSEKNMQKFMQDRNFLSPLHLTSAKTGEGCDQLRKAIVTAINWTDLPLTTSPVFYQMIKQEIMQMRDSKIILIRLSELKQRIELTFPSQPIDLNELQTVIGLLEGPGIIQRLDFGGFILLRPEILSRYAAAVVRMVRKHEHELGCILEKDLLEGKLDYQDFQRLAAEEERVVLHALNQIFVSRAWCLRQPYESTSLLTFPSYFRRERPEQLNHPGVLVTYRFSGPVDDIYATLVVRLHHSEAFETDQLWRFAADFQTQTKEGLGVKLTRETEGRAKLEVYFNPGVDENSRVVFLRYIHSHLETHASEVIRLRHYSCSKCNRPFIDHVAIEEALASLRRSNVYCAKCGTSIRIIDSIESKFQSADVRRQVQLIENEIKNSIDNESKELILVGHTYAVVGEAGQIYRTYANSDQGLDGEIEFKDDQGNATGKRLYLQLKSGDSYLKHRERDDVEVFQIKKARWAEYWQRQAYPVMLVIRTSDGKIRWMDVSEYLKQENPKRQANQIIFDGGEFNVLSVREWRDRILG